MKLLPNEQQESYENANISYISKEKYEDKYLKGKKYPRVRDHCHYIEEYRGAVHSVCNLKYCGPKNISIFSHQGSNYDYHSIIKELAEEFQKQFTYLGEIHNLYSSDGKKVTIIDKNG